MSSVTEQLERIDILRKRAIQDPRFVDAAKEHEQLIVQSIQPPASSTKPRKKKKRERLSQIYSDLPEQQPIYY
ncbi:hypothetical protein AB4562_04785 [Vibrio sp. 10N.222.54.A1]|jgi:hypothetical protein|uniref:hypothetical protein n=1 Tax=unclassified Vibrio TaxID=2614977 RepID=UPI003553E773